MDTLGFRTLAPDTKPDAGEAWRQVLLDAADRIERFGWCQGGTGKGPNGEKCLGLTLLEFSKNLSRHAACGHLSLHIGLKASEGFVCWNDAPGRTAAEVCAALRECARS